MERTQFTFYASFYEALSRIKKKADRAEAYDILCQYALYGTEPNLDTLPDSVAIAFSLIKPNLTASRRKAESGQAGGTSKQTTSKAKADGKQEEPPSKKKNEKEEEKEKEYECTPLYPLTWGKTLIAAMDSWQNYKREKHRPYKPQGLKSLIAQIDQSRAEHGEDALVAVINRSMAANYEGIAWGLLDQQQEPNSDPKQNANDLAADLDYLRQYMAVREAET